MDKITCPRCGREQVSTHLYCEMCAKDLRANDSVSSSKSKSDSQDASPKFTMPAQVEVQFAGVEVAAKDALTQARLFSNINKIVFILGMVGAILLILFSLVPSCPPIQNECYSDEKALYSFATLMPMGIGSLLSVLWLNGIAETIASRAALAAEVAKASVK